MTAGPECAEDAKPGNKSKEAANRAAERAGAGTPGGFPGLNLEFLKLQRFPGWNVSIWTHCNACVTPLRNFSFPSVLYDIFDRIRKER